MSSSAASSPPNGTRTGGRGGTTAGRRLNRWVDRLRDTTLENIPYVDPTAAATAPGCCCCSPNPPATPRTAAGSEPLRERRDSANLYRATDRAGLGHEVTLHWHLVPWWIANPNHEPRRLAGRSCVRRPGSGSSSTCSVRRPARWCCSARPRRRRGRCLIGGAGSLAAAPDDGSRAPHPNPLVHDRLDPVTGRRNGDRLVEVLRDAGRRARGEGASGRARGSRAVLTTLPIPQLRAGRGGRSTGGAVHPWSGARPAGSPRSAVPQQSESPLPPCP